MCVLDSRATHTAGPTGGANTWIGQECAQHGLAGADLAVHDAGGFLWKARTTSSWCTGVPPLSSHSRTTTEANALVWVIVHAWQDWCLLNGVDVKDAPVDGIGAAVQGVEADGA